MHNRELVHVVKSLQDLKTEAFGQSNREALEIVILDELVQIDAEHFENDEDVTSEDELVFDAHNVLGVVVVAVSQGLQNLDFNFALFV